MILESFLSILLVLASVWPFCLTCFCFRVGSSEKDFIKLLFLSCESRQSAAFVSGFSVGQSDRGKILHFRIHNIVFHFFFSFQFSFFFFFFGCIVQLTGF